MLLIHAAIGATFRRWRHLRLRSVSQLQEARKPASTRVSHLLSTQPVQTATDATAVSLTDPAGRSAYDTPGDDRGKSRDSRTGQPGPPTPARQLSAHTRRVGDLSAAEWSWPFAVLAPGNGELCRPGAAAGDRSP